MKGDMKLDLQNMVPASDKNLYRAVRHVTPTLEYHTFSGKSTSK